MTEQLDRTSEHVHEHAEGTKRNTDEMMIAFKEVATGMESQMLPNWIPVPCVPVLIAPAMDCELISPKFSCE